MKTEISWDTDGFGRVRGISVHDSYLFEFLFSDARTISLAMKHSSGKITMMELSGVGDTNLASLSNGAIISDIYIWKVGEVPDICWNIPDSAWNALFYNRLASADAKKTVAQIVLDKPDSFLVQVECSYGCAIASVCDHVLFFNRPDGGRPENEGGRSFIVHNQ